MRSLPTLPQEAQERLLGELSVLLLVVDDPNNVCGDAAAAGIFCAISSSSLLSSITMAVSLVLCGELGRSSTPPPSMVKSMASSIAVVNFYVGLYRRPVAGDMSCEQKNDMINANRSAKGGRRARKRANKRSWRQRRHFYAGADFDSIDLLDQCGVQFFMILVYAKTIKGYISLMEFILACGVRRSGAGRFASDVV